MAVDPDSDIYTNQAAAKAYQVAGHHAETHSQPPPKPTEERNTENEDQRFHKSNRQGAILCENKFPGGVSHWMNLSVGEFICGV